MSDEEVKITLTLRQAATMSIIATTYLAQILHGNMKLPITGMPATKETVADIADIVERINVAVGNEPSITIRELIYELRERQRTED